MAIKPAKPHHVVAIPYPAQGHINPMLQLCQQLVPRGFTFTFVNTHHIHHRLLLAANVPPTRDYDHDDACPSVDAAHHAQDAHVHDPHHGINPTHNEDLQVPHQFEDDHHIQKTHHGQDADANDANARAHEVHQFRSIRMVYVAGGCAPEQHAHVSTASEAFRAAQDMCEPVEHLLSRLVEEQAVDFIMSDILLGWSSATAHKFGLPWVSFWPASTASLSTFIYFSDLLNQGDASLRIAEMESEGAPLIEGIPGLPPTRLCDVPKLWDGQGKLYEPVCKFFKGMEQASYVLVNTFAELEGQVVEALSTRFPIHAVGPLLPSRYMLHTCPASMQLQAAGPSLGRRSLFPEDTTCLTWLDKQSPSSVLFISFGSISLRSPQQLHELAKGVEASGCPFLWVCKPDIDNGPDKTRPAIENGPDNNGLDNNGLDTENGPHNNRPATENGSQNNGHHGFLPHVDGRSRGLIVPWAPQLEVLSHPAVGGFITHCGWNSIIESVSMGVPMICWADSGERMSNQRFVVEFWQCGIDMVADSRRAKQHIDEAVLVGRDDVEKAVRFLMLEEGGASLRDGSLKMRNAATKAYQDSHAQLNEFSQTMQQRCCHVVESSR